MSKGVRCGSFRSKVEEGNQGKLVKDSFKDILKKIEKLEKNLENVTDVGSLKEIKSDMQKVFKTMFRRFE